MPLPNPTFGGIATNMAGILSHHGSADIMPQQHHHHHHNQHHHHPSNHHNNMPHHHHNSANAAANYRQRTAAVYERHLQRLEENLEQIRIDSATLHRKMESLGNKLAAADDAYGPLPDLKDLRKAKVVANKQAATQT